MPNTMDDVAEKIADLLLNEGSKMGAAASRGIPATVSTLASASAKTLARLRQQIRNDKELRRLMGLEGEVSDKDMSEAIRKLGLVSSTVHVADADSNELAELLEERKVLFARVDKTDDNCKLFVFLTQDADKVKDAIELMEARRGMVSELNPQLFFNSMQPEKVKEISGLDRVELELFRHYARKEGLVYTVMPTADEKYSIYHEAGQKWQSKANLIMTQMSWMLSGPQKELVRKQLEARIAGRNTLQMSLDDAQKELYIVSQSNPGSYIHITEKDFTQYKNGKEVHSYHRNRDDFAVRAMAYSDSLERPVVLQPDEFRSDLTATDLAKYPTMDFLSHGYDEMKETEKLNSLIDLVCMKAGLDNENNAGISLWDSSISFSAFAENENYMDDASRQIARADYERLQETAEYPKKHFRTEELDMDHKNIDFILMRAEEKRRAQSAPPGRSREQEAGISM